MFWTTIGATAATLTMFAFIPQIVKAHKSKSVKDVSLLTLIQLSAGVSLWIVYGVHLKDIIIIFANAVTLVTMFILFSFYFKYHKNERIKL